MARDFSLSIETGFMAHVKTRKFCRLMGNPMAFGHLVALWAWAVEAAPSGDLSGIDVPEIELGAGHDAMDDTCYRALVATGFIDEGPNGARSLHNWMEPGRTGYALQKLEAERDRWRRRVGIKAATPAQAAPTEPPAEPRGVPAEAPVESRGVHVPSRFTVHGSEEISPVSPAPARDPLPEAPHAPPPVEPHVRVDAFAAAHSAHFDRVLLAYPRKDAKARAGLAFQALAATYPGGEKALADAILAAFPVMLKRAPYNGPNDKRPYLETVLAERRWEDPESAPDAAQRADPRCNLHRQQGTFRQLPRGGPVAGCPTCKENSAARGTRDSPPTSAADALPRFTPGKAWTPKELAEAEALRKGVDPPKAAAGGAK